MMARILALMTDAFGGRGGIAQYNRDLATALANGGHAMTILPRHARDPISKLPHGVTQHKARPGRVCYASSALTLAARIGPRIVFCGHLFLAPLAALITRLTGARLIVQLHGIEAWEAPGRMRRRAVEKARLVLSVSRHTRERALSWAASAPERVAVAPNTVREIFIPGDRGLARARFGLNHQGVLLSVGRLDKRERYKGHDRVIEALAALRDREPGLLYIIAGEGDDRPRLETLAATCGARRQVRFLGAVGDEALPDLYRAADLFVLPSTGEGFGIVFLEAMACGTPALGLAVAGACDALADGAMGFMARPGDDMATAIMDALANPRPDPAELASEVARRFGHAAFARRINTLIGGAAV